ncbi:MAG: N-6 DNA methylase [Alphaproteobacteria bacterium]|nr:N-6 DNA methylase [Alphaproteobacteria bacterium]
MTDIAAYFDAIAATWKGGQATEHSYRPALHALFNGLNEQVKVTNEPRRVSAGAPDFIFMRGDVPVGHCEAKDVGADLKALKGYSVEQKQRYLKGFPNLLYTNGLDFEFWREGERIRTVSIGEVGTGLQPKSEAFAELEAQLKDFVAQTPRTINSSKRLAELMAAKAVLIKDVMGRALVADLKRDADTDLTAQYHAFREHLIHDITAADFADIYAETIAYGLFAARLHDPTPASFTRQEALELLPKSNPFLRRLFSYIAGVDLDARMAWIIDDLTKIFLACDLKRIMADFGQLTGQNDPFLHFYETFLAAYNPAKRKARGVWYTPEPVVNFIVRAVDEVLKTEFGLADGLADTSKITIDFDTGQTDRKGKAITEKREVHRVQILDPATGTGTFLAEVIKQIGARVKGAAPGHWSSYVEAELIPRIHGFELLMASYAMCHMKLDMILTEMGYRPSGAPPRLSVYLTNSLEEGERVEQVLFARWLAEEAREASKIKRDMPIMCVIGNPPYSGHSSNKGEWINSLMDAYKQSPELKRPAQAKWLSDDYVKFIRFGEHMIAKNGEGVLGFITNHGYLDNPTFLDMRRHLMETFDTIYVLDLHGNTKKKEVSPDGSADKNVFDIQQGVAIIIAVKKGTTATGNSLATVFHGDVWGKRSEKYGFLEKQTLKGAGFSEVTPAKAPWPFVPRDGELLVRYEKGFSLAELFSPNGSPAPGIVTTQDQFAISWDAAEAAEKVRFLLATATEAEARSRFRLCSQAQWSYAKAKTELPNQDWELQIVPISYRPFDRRFTVYNAHVAVHLRDRAMRHMLEGKNIGLAFNRTVEQRRPFTDALVFNGLIQHHSLSLKEVNYLAPLYLYPDDNSLDQTRRVNFDPKIWRKLRELAKDDAHGEPDEVAIFDYIYGVLHSPDYRGTFAEFLKTDFPRIPWPASPGVFWHVSEKGGSLRRLHLMEPGAVGAAPFPFIGEGDSVVDKPDVTQGSGGTGAVWINKTQRFEDVPQIAWDFYIGGYQPARKWLKDRKGRTLSFADIQHYQRIIKILSETHRIMGEIELPLPGAGDD